MGRKTVCAVLSLLVISIFVFSGCATVQKAEEQVRSWISMRSDYFPGFKNNGQIKVSLISEKDTGVIFGDIILDLISIKVEVKYQTEPITVDSKPGYNTSFTYKIPVQDGKGFVTYRFQGQNKNRIYLIKSISETIEVKSRGVRKTFEIIEALASLTQNTNSPKLEISDTPLAETIKRNMVFVKEYNIKS